MRLFLDAHLSGRAVGRALRDRGHDVVALDEHRELDAIGDSELLELASAEGRILVTHNVADFPGILRDWAEERRSHRGCVIIVGIRLDQFGLLIRAIEAALERQVDQDAWIDRSVLVGRDS